MATAGAARRLIGPVKRSGSGGEETGASRGAAPQVSVVVPLYNEADNVDPAIEELLGVLDGMPETAEVIVVDDGSRDGTGGKAFAWQAHDRRVKVVQFRRNFGQTAAISAGLHASSGRVVVLMDGDQQNDPKDIPKLLAEMDKGCDVVSGWRVNRQDKLIMRKFPSRLANRLISRTTGIELHDYGCTLKAYRADVVEHLRLYGELHRFIPALAAMAGAEVVEVPVNHRARTRGKSKYGISRTVRVMFDLLTVKFLLKYLVRPMQFFGRVAVACIVASILSIAALVAQQVFGSSVLNGGTWVGIAALFAAVAVVICCIGLLGEMVTRVYFEHGDRRTYVVRRQAGFEEEEELVVPVVAAIGVDLRAAAREQ